MVDNHTLRIHVGHRGGRICFSVKQPGDPMPTTPDPAQAPEAKAPGKRDEFTIVSIMGYHQEPRSVDMKTWNWKGLDVVNSHVRDRARLRDDWHAACKLYERAAAIAAGIGADPSLRAHVQGFALVGRLDFLPADETTEGALADTIALADRYGIAIAARSEAG